MATQATISITPGTGQLLDAVSLTIGPNTVVRETMVIADPTAATNLATVNSSGALNVADAVLEACITTNSLSVFLPTSQILALTPPTAAAIAAAIVANPPAVTVTGGVSTNIATWNSVALGSPSVYGTAPGAVNVIGVNAYVTTLPAVTVAASQTIAVTNTGTFAVQATLSAETTKVIGTVNQGTSPWIVAGGGTAGFPGTAVLTIQGVGSGTAVPVSGAFYQGTQPISIASGQVASGAFVSGAIASGAIANGAIAAGAAAAGAFADGSVYVRSNAAATFPVTATIAAAQTIAVTNAGTFAVQVSGTIATRPAAPTTANWSLLPISVSASGANIIIAGVAGQTVRVMRMNFQNASPTTATSVTIQDTTPTSFSGAYYLNVGGSYNGTDSNGEPLFVSAVNEGIQLNSTAAVLLAGSVWYTQS